MHYLKFKSHPSIRLVLGCPLLCEVLKESWEFWEALGRRVLTVSGEGSCESTARESGRQRVLLRSEPQLSH